MGVPPWARGSYDPSKIMDLAECEPNFVTLSVSIFLKHLRVLISLIS